MDLPRGTGEVGDRHACCSVSLERRGRLGCCEGRDTHILLRVRFNLVATRRRTGGAPLKAWRMHSLYWATTVSHMNTHIPRVFHTIIRLRGITQAANKLLFPDLMVIVGLQWTSLASFIIKLFVCCLYLVWSCISLRETAKRKAMQPMQCLHNRSCYTITMFQLTIRIYLMYTFIVARPIWYLQISCFVWPTIKNLYSV